VAIRETGNQLVGPPWVEVARLESRLTPGDGCDGSHAVLKGTPRCQSHPDTRRRELWPPAPRRSAALEEVCRRQNCAGEAKPGVLGDTASAGPLGHPTATPGAGYQPSPL